MKRAGKFSTSLGKDREREVSLGTRGIKGVTLTAKSLKEGVSLPSGRAGERLGVVRKWEVFLMFIFA